MSLANLWRDIAAHWRELLLLLTATALLTIYWYKGYHFYFKDKFKDSYGHNEYFEWMAHAWQFAAAWALLVIAPVIFIKIFVHRPLSDFGVAWGRAGVGIFYVAVACAIMTPFLKKNALNPEFYNEYPLVHGLYGKNVVHMIAWELTYLTYYIPFEFIFRGFIQQGLAPTVGVTLAICFQMLPSVVIHNNKPQGETFAAIGGAFLMGFLIALTGSLVWPILLHWYVGAATDYFCWLEWKKAVERGESVREALVIK